MIISGKYKRKKAILVTPERLRELSDILLKHCERIEYNARTKAGTRIEFESIEELLSYDNFKTRRIVELELTGYRGYSRVIEVSLGDQNYSILLNYGSTIRCDYKLSTIDEESILLNNIKTWFEKSKCSYWFLGKFSLSGMVFVPSFFISFVRFVSGSKAEFDTSNIHIWLILALVTIGMIGIWGLIGFIDEHFLANLFPAVAFKWGEEAERYDKWGKYRSNLLWGVIIAIIIGLVTSYLYDSIKG